MSGDSDRQLLELLADRRDAIGRAWFDGAVAIYADEYGRFLSQNRDPFANPVGNILRNGLDELFDALLDGADVERRRAALEPIVRIKAVQEAPPSKALAFVPLLKRVVRDACADQPRAASLADAIDRFEARIDDLMLLAFDIYAECRERLFQVRINELKRNAAAWADADHPSPRRRRRGGASSGGPGDSQQG